MMRVLLLIFSILHLHINTGVNGQAAGEHCGYYGSCDPYLVCEYPVCKNMIGRPCSSTSPCVHTSTCSGTSETTCQCPGNSVPNHDNTLCVLKAGDGCSSGNSIKCMSGTSCENNVCKIEIGRPCLNTSLCVHISTCSGISETRCQCPDNTVPKYDYTVCELKAGEECSSSNSLNCTYGTTCENNVCKNKIGSPCSNTSSCVRTSTCSGISETTCQCPDNAVPNYDLTVCELNVGEECGNWNSLNCTIGTTCENNVCKLNIFERCEFGNETCVHLATCSNIYEMCVCPSNRYPTYDLTKCALTIGDMCETRDDVCLDIAVCRGVDEPTCECPSNTVNVGLHRCALKIGERCSEDDLCTHIATCKDTCQCPQNYVPSRNRGRCGLKLNETCSGYNICLDNAECSYLTGTCQCRANYTSTSDGTACSVNSVGLDGDCTSQACANGLTCENNVCMIDVEGSCAGINSTKCKTGLTCEADKCKQTLHGPCTTSTQCKTGLGCDIDKKCRKLVGQDCSGEEECVKNADCNTTCKCKTGFSQQGGMCSDAYKTTGSLFILAAALLLKSRLG